MLPSRVRKLFLRVFALPAIQVWRSERDANQGSNIMIAEHDSFELHCCRESAFVHHMSLADAQFGHFVEHEEEGK